VTLANPSIGFPQKPLFIRLVRALEGSEARVHTAGATGVNQKTTAAEETPLDFADRRHRLHHLYTDSDRRDGFLHYPVLDLIDLFRII
jgi:hypothetical protein